MSPLLLLVVGLCLTIQETGEQGKWSHLIVQSNLSRGKNDFFKLLQDNYKRCLLINVFFTMPSRH